MFVETSLQILGLSYVQAVGGRVLQHLNGKHVEGKLGSPRRTRTYNLAVNSRPLYQLSYRGSFWILWPPAYDCQGVGSTRIEVCAPPIYIQYSGGGASTSHDIEPNTRLQYCEGVRRRKPECSAYTAGFDGEGIQ